jgi:hypothetical protein
MSVFYSNGTDLAPFNEGGSPFQGNDGLTRVKVIGGEIRTQHDWDNGFVGFRLNRAAAGDRYIHFNYRISRWPDDRLYMLQVWNGNYLTQLLQLDIVPASTFNKIQFQLVDLATATLSPFSADFSVNTTYKLELQMTDTSFVLMVNGSTAITFPDRSLSGKTFGIMQWGDYDSGGLLGEQYFDNIMTSDTGPTSQVVNPTGTGLSTSFGAPTMGISLWNAGGITSTSTFGSGTITQTDPPPAPPPDWEAIGKEDQKVYVYKVYEADGTFLGTWTDVADDLRFSQRINTPGTTTTVKLSRSPNSTKEVRANLTTEAGEPIITQDLERLTVTYETNNSVGEDTDVDINYNVDVYVHYGEFGSLVTEAGDSLTTEDGDNLIVAIGAPGGVRVFSGFILDYESLYGERTGVAVTLASHGAELANELVRSGETIIVTYSSTPIETALKSILDTNPQTMSYDTASIEATGVSVTSKFQLNTKLEAIESLYDQTPEGWYWYGNVADNNVYLKPTATTPHHTFRKGYHVKEVALRRSMEQLRNRIYFVGGDVSGTSILKKYEDATSQTSWRVGLQRITDRRYTVTDSIQRYATKQMSRYKNPIYTTTVTISSARYDLESIKLGQIVGFDNFGNFVDGLSLQIVGLSYTPTAVTLDLGEVLQAQHERIEELNEGLQGEQYLKLPSTPS